MTPKLIALDMDGTLLDSRKNLPKDFIDWVKRHSDVKTVIASGRQYDTLVKDFVPVKDSLIFIAENGGLVFEKDQILYSNEMKKSDVETCLKATRHLSGLTPILCGAKSAYIMPVKESIRKEADIYYARLTQTTDLIKASQNDAVVKIAFYVEKKQAEAAMNYFSDIPSHLSAVLSGDSWIDVSNKTVSKGSAVTVAQQAYGISPKDCMAFGDYLNDADLLRCCEESYCMANVHPDLKAIAKYTADSNDNDGVMKILRNF